MTDTKHSDPLFEPLVIPEIDQCNYIARNPAPDAAHGAQSSMKEFAITYSGIPADLARQIREERRELVEALRDLGFDSAEAGLYESEYDGRVYTFCLYCDYQDDVRPQHSDTCPTRKARALLAREEKR